MDDKAIVTIRTPLGLPLRGLGASLAQASIEAAHGPLQPDNAALAREVRLESPYLWEVFDPLPERAEEENHHVTTMPSVA